MSYGAVLLAYYDGVLLVPCASVMFTYYDGILFVYHDSVLYVYYGGHYSCSAMCY